MNKHILLQSIKSVSGFLAILLFVFYMIIVGLEKWPEVSVPILIIGIFCWMVWMEYKRRSD